MSSGSHMHLNVLFVAVFPLVAAMLPVEYQSRTENTVHFCPVFLQSDIGTIIDVLTSEIAMCFTENQNREPNSDLQSQDRTDRLRGCPAFQSSLQCSSDFMQRMEECSPQQPIVNILSLAIAVMKTAICTDPASKPLETMKHLTCEDQPTTIMRQCLEKLSKLTTITLSRFTFAECHDMRTTRDCFNRYALQCGTPRVIDILNRVYRNLVEKTLCDNPEN
ncbi:uncharacterized protein LOC131691383 isoform X1 [Topomyia yanbarensis]|nr:uncharacterized protein LOC131691383 isoform X1 [Topomyia yanbarensis]XP_058833703.1 uncharacterized protein LOC131691383 isoform X1 [Topomyia yanbarensis]XP_058833704.1 uncharacterized protein LOC131691383 isoform X1 [Topomyia yanbarensis]XP_058833705.1 uncharacterized protein LOC131691383 isoform X1 [Topomyia yanbarensis]XP_058833706.1 uncharacterized protein LOC131691383 isoform X1 [Topomyia yanbarensis]